MANLPTAPQQKGDASSSSASTSTYPRYDVFISHRGSDVKNTFASHLYQRLRDHGLWVFLDKPELEPGHEFQSQIEAAIRVASVQIAIFSPAYAESKWCLDELVLMVESRAPILPIFYNVEPFEVRWNDKKGVYAEALKKLQQKTIIDPQTNTEKPRHDSATIQGWRDALSHVADISGLELKTFNGNEAELLDKVVQSLLKKVPKTPLLVAKYPTGLDDKLHDFECAVLPQEGQEQNERVTVVGIVGMVGIGKTTLAKQIFNRRWSDYNGSSFLFDVRETAAKRSLIDLQMKLIKDLTHIDIKIDSLDHGVMMLKRYLASCNAMIVLDDVDRADQLDAFLPVKDVLSSNSLILVTSRDKGVLISSGIADSSIYKLTGMNRAHSQELFCSYAFSQLHPLPGFTDLVEGFVTACDGLPLALKVTGVLLICQRDDTYWKQLLNEFHKIPPGDILEILIINYNSLDQEYQRIFLDMACFSIGEDMDTAKRIWGAVGVSNLESKCLLELDSKNRIKMHDQVRDMGRYVADQTSMPRRLRCDATNNNIDKLFEESSWPVTTEVRGISTLQRADDFHYGFGVDNQSTRSEMSWYKRCSQEMLGSCKRALFNTDRYHGLQILASEDYYVEVILRRVRSPHLIWLRWYKCPYSSLPSWVPLENLRVLEVRGSRLKTLWRQESQPPLQLRELNIYSPFSDFPKSIGQLKYLEKIVVDYDETVQPQATYSSISDYPKSKTVQPQATYSSISDYPKSKTVQLKTLPEEFCYMSSLKYLTLRHFTRMRSLPYSLGKLTNLQHIDLSYATSLEMLPDSIGRLANLQSIDLSYCSSLAMLPNSFGNLTRLKRLSLKECRNVTISKETLGNITTLEVLDLSCCRKVKELPPQVTHQRFLRELYWGDTELKELTPQVQLQEFLREFYLLNAELKKLPSGISDLCNLEVLHLGDRLLEALPSSLGSLNSLKELEVRNCFAVICLPDTFVRLTQLTRLTLESCGIQRLPPDVLLLNNLEYFRIADCPLGKLPFKTAERKRKTVAASNELDGSNGKCRFGFERLQEFELDRVQIREVTFPEGVCRNLQQLHLSRCKELRRIGRLCGQEKLITLEISECEKVEELTCLQTCTSLKHLSVSKCSKLKALGHLPAKLVTLNLLECDEIEELPSLEHLTSLYFLSVLGCSKLKTIQGLEHLTNLLMLCLARVPEIEELPVSENLLSLLVYACPKFKCIQGLEQHTCLALLRVEECGEIEELRGVEHVMSLQILEVIHCPKLQWRGRVLEQLRQRLKGNFIYEKESKWHGGHYIVLVLAAFLSLFWPDGTSSIVFVLSAFVGMFLPHYIRKPAV